MSEQLHQFCDECWDYGSIGREPVRIAQPARQQCCVCGRMNRSGIYVRVAANRMPCGGVGGYHDGEARAR